MKEKSYAVRPPLPACSDDDERSTQHASCPPKSPLSLSLSLSLSFTHTHIPLSRSHIDLTPQLLNQVSFPKIQNRSQKKELWTEAQICFCQSGDFIFDCSRSFFLPPPPPPMVPFRPPLEPPPPQPSGTPNSLRAGADIFCSNFSLRQLFLLGRRCEWGIRVLRVVSE